MRRVSEAISFIVLLAVVGARGLEAGTITGVTAGPGLTGGGTNGDVTLSANFGGDGVSQNVCRADHTHGGEVWYVLDQPRGLRVRVNCSANDFSCIQSALFGESLATAGSGSGVSAVTYSTTGFGVAGDNLATSGKSIAISGYATSPDGTGVAGTAGGTTTGSPIGVQGYVNAPLGVAVQGFSYATTGAGYGVSGKTNSPSGIGVSGVNRAASGQAIGVDGETLSPAGSGGFFRNQAGGTGLRVRVDHSTSTTKFIAASNGAYLSAGGAWTNASDVNLKDHFSPIDDGGVLRKLQAMPIEEWSYKSEGASVRHVGPTAQDFRAAFALGTDDKTITTVDEAGIALVAIQELDRRTAEIVQLKEQVARLEAAVQALQAAGKN